MGLDVENLDFIGCALIGNMVALQLASHFSKCVVLLICGV